MIKVKQKESNSRKIRIQMKQYIYNIYQLNKMAQMNKNLELQQNDDLQSLSSNNLKHLMANNETNQQKKPQGLNLFESLLSTGCQQELFGEIANNFYIDESQIQIQKLFINDFEHNKNNGIKVFGRLENSRTNKKKQAVQLDDQYVISEEDLSLQRIKKSDKNRNKRHNRLPNKIKGNSKNIMVVYKTIFKSYFERMLSKQEIPKIFQLKEYLNLTDLNNLFSDSKLYQLIHEMFESSYIERELQLSRCISINQKNLYRKKIKKLKACFENNIQLKSIM